MLGVSLVPLLMLMANRVCHDERQGWESGHGTSACKRIT